eukprot:jgi/Botrbrau1/20963/Bobra.0135s0081.1
MAPTKRPARSSAKAPAKAVIADAVSSGEPQVQSKAPITRVGRIVELSQKALRPDPDIRWEKDDLLDVIYWIRQVVAIILGLICGSIPLTGWVGLAGAITINILVVLSWYRVQRIDEEEYGGHVQLATEGLPPSISLFLIIWILTYSFQQH